MLEQVNLLDVIPVRLAEWTERGDQVVVVRPRPMKTGIGGFMDRLAHALSAKRIRLDAVGSFAWRRMDGELSVGQVAALLRGQYGQAVEPAEERLGHLIRVLRREGFVAYRGWDDERLDGQAAGNRLR